MNRYDLCVAWNWEYDAEFMTLLRNNFLSRGLSVLEVTPDNLDERLNALIGRKIIFRVFLDRASEDDKRFEPFVQRAIEQNVFYINHHDRAKHSWNKAVMHYELINAGIYTPYTIVLPPFEEKPDISSIDFASLSEPFIVKPVQGSGGEGVVMGVTSQSQVQILRKKHCNQTFLLRSLYRTTEIG